MEGMATDTLQQCVRLVDETYTLFESASDTQRAAIGEKVKPWMNASVVAPAAAHLHRLVEKPRSIVKAAFDTSRSFITASTDSDRAVQCGALLKCKGFDDAAAMVEESCVGKLDIMEVQFLLRHARLGISAAFLYSGRGKAVMNTMCLDAFAAMAKQAVGFDKWAKASGQDFPELGAQISVDVAGWCKDILKFVELQDSGGRGGYGYGAPQGERKGRHLSWRVRAQSFFMGAGTELLW